LNYSIIPANWRDVGALRHLEKVCFPEDAWPLLDLIAVLSMSNIVRLKAVSNETMIGFIAGELRIAEEMAWIATLAVLPEYRRQGIGAALLAACEARLSLRKVRLTVRAENQAAIDLYLKTGYRKVGYWPDYYNGGGAALVLEKEAIEKP